jgi:poly(A) polymerase
MKKTATDIVKKLRKSGYAAYFVGGCVRDMVMGKKPKDFDIATSARPEEVMRLFPQTLTVGAQFGVVLVVQNGHPYEVATFRSDGPYEDGRHPKEVVYTDDPRSDVLRRDFTINGLLYDPIAETALDFVEGQRDIRNGIVRTIGEPNQRFLEDKLRLMRAVRFAARFGYKLHADTRQSISELALKINQVSQERIRDELVKILTEGYSARGISLLEECHLLQQILPEVSRLKGVPQPPEFHPEGDVWTHTMLMLELMDQTKRERHSGNGVAPIERSPLSKTPAEFRTQDLGTAPHPPRDQTPAVSDPQNYPSISLAMSVLLHDIGKPPTFKVQDRIRFNNHPEVGARMAAGICERFRFTNKQSDQITRLVSDHLKFKDLPHMRPSTLKRFLRQDGFDEHLELHRLDCLGSHRNLDNWKYAKEMLERLEPEEIRPSRLLTGDDLILMGHRPGPLFKEILKAVEDAQLDNQIHSPEEARQYVLSRFPVEMSGRSREPRDGGQETGEGRGESGVGGGERFG